ncbi:MAG TPA: hypothetical protein PK447_10050, partial [Ignavibacteria bacterium]|nr:hypothetical protein [Ignavibacteria bacterium]
MKQIFKKFGRTNTVLSGITLFLIFWAIVLSLFVSYVIKSTDKNWDSIQSEKISKEKASAENYFNIYQKNLDDICGKTVKNLDFRSSVENNNYRKVFEFITRTISQNDIVCEIYDIRLNPVAFYGRQLESDNLTLTRAASGEKFSVIKDIGFYTYLIIYCPLKSVNDENKVIGVYSIAQLIDVKYQLINKYYPDFGITSDVLKSTGSEVTLYTTEALTGLNNENKLWKDKIYVDLKGLHGSIIGRIQFPDFDRQQYIQDINSSLSRFISLLVFAASVLAVILFLRITGKTASLKYSIFKILMFGGLLGLIRVLFLVTDFPSAIIKSEVFAPQYYSSQFLSVFYKSLGEMLISVLFVLALIVYIAHIYSEKDFQDETGIKLFWKSGKAFFAAAVLLILVFYNCLFKIFGDIIHNILVESDIRFFDKSNFLPNPELLIFELIFLIITFSLFFLNSSF